IHSVELLPRALQECQGALGRRVRRLTADSGRINGRLARRTRHKAHQAEKFSRALEPKASSRAKIPRQPGSWAPALAEFCPALEYRHPASGQIFSTIGVESPTRVQTLYARGAFCSGGPAQSSDRRLAAKPRLE